MAGDTNNLAIETTGLTKIFRDFWGHQKVLAVDNLNLKVRRHEVFGLLGPNGSGKSTTIKMLMGLLFPTRGWAKVLDRPPGDIKTNFHLGYLPEDSHLYSFLDARETLDFYGRLFNLNAGERRRRIDSLLEMVGLSGVTHRLVGEYSKGMARRIGLAQALINDPEVLILDEPTSGLDPIGTRQIKDLIRELARRGKTVLMCSHLLADVEDVCDRISILYGGKVQAEGSVEELLARREMTQICSGRLEADTIAKIEDLIHTQHAGYAVEVQTPRDRLEDYFLRIVSQAQAQKLETSGVVMGGEVSEFLGAGQPAGDEAEAIIEELVAGHEAQKDMSSDREETPAASKEGATPANLQDDIRQEVIQSLLDVSTTAVEVKKPDAQPAKEEISATTSVDTPDKPADDSEIINRSIIDRLTMGGPEPKPTAQEDSPQQEDDAK